MTLRILTFSARNKLLPSASCAALVLAACGGGGGEPQPGTTTITLFPSQDATLYESSGGTLASGAGAELFVGRTNGRSGDPLRRTLVQFDVAGNVPSSATIDAVSLRIDVTKVSDAAPVTINIHEVLESWSEGASDAGSRGGQGTIALSGDATWVHRSFDTQTWGVAGGVFDASADGALTNVGGAGEYASTDANLAMRDTARAWAQNPASNFGWILIGDEASAGSARVLGSREAGEAIRPTLSITYTVP